MAPWQSTSDRGTVERAGLGSYRRPAMVYGRREIFVEESHERVNFEAILLLRGLMNEKECSSLPLHKVRNAGQVCTIHYSYDAYLLANISLTLAGSYERTDLLPGYREVHGPSIRRSPIQSVGLDSTAHCRQ